MTKHNHGSHYGCRISAMPLGGILERSRTLRSDAGLIAGNTLETLATFALGNSQSKLYATDFFVTATDHCYGLGRLVASDVMNCGTLIAIGADSETETLSIPCAHGLAAVPVRELRPRTDRARVIMR